MAEYAARGGVGCGNEERRDWHTDNMQWRSDNDFLT